MEVKHIRYFVEVARRGSINKAARSMGIAQPALTRYLHALEDEVGAQLLFRSQRGVTLTHTGEILLQHGRSVLEQMLNLQEAVVQAKATLAGTVRLGFVPSVAFTLTPILLEQSAHQFPNVRLQIVEAARATIREWLVDGSLDIALIQELEGEPELRQRYVAEEAMVLVGAPGHGGFLGPTVTWEAVSRIPLIMTPGLDEFVASWAKEQLVRLHVVHKVNSIHAVMETVRGGALCSIVPRSVVAQRTASGELKAAGFANPPITRRLVAAYSALRPLAQPVVAVQQLLADAVCRLPLSSEELATDVAGQADRRPPRVDERAKESRRMDASSSENA